MEITIKKCFLFFLFPLTMFQTLSASKIDNCNIDDTFQQSPIDISKNITIKNLPRLRLHGYNLPFENLTLTNDGITVKLEIKSKIQPYISNIPLTTGDDEYVFDSIEYRWGNNDFNGSEHKINSVSYSLEMQIIHFKREYKNFTEAIKHSDGILILAVMFETNSSPILNVHGTSRISRALMEIQNGKRLEQLEINEPTLCLKDFLGDLIIEEFYVYEGTTTRGPCSHAKWIVFPDTLEISSNVMAEVFHKMSNQIGDKIEKNNRAIHSLDSGIEVYHRKPTTGAYFIDIFQEFLGLLETFDL